MWFLFIAAYAYAQCPDLSRCIDGRNTTVDANFSYCTKGCIEDARGTCCENNYSWLSNLACSSCNDGKNCRACHGEDQELDDCLYLGIFDGASEAEYKSSSTCEGSYNRNLDSSHCMEHIRKVCCKNAERLFGLQPYTDKYHENADENVYQYCKREFGDNICFNYPISTYQSDYMSFGIHLDDYITIHLDSDAVSCSQIFHEDSLALHGSNPTCGFEDQLITVTFGSAPTLCGRQTIQLLPEILSYTEYHYSSQGFNAVQVYNSAETYVIPRMPDNNEIQAVISTMDGQTENLTVNVCDNSFVVSGHLSSGNLGRDDYKYIWALINLEDEQDQDTLLLGDYQSINIRNEQFRTRTSFNVQLITENCLGDQSKDTKIIEVINEANFNAYFDVDLTQIARGQLHEFPLIIQATLCQIELTNLQYEYEWSTTNSDSDFDGTTFEDIIDNMSTPKRTLVIPENILSSGRSYSFLVVIRPTDESLGFTQVNLDFTVLPARPLVAAIIAPEVLDIAQSYVIDGSRSFDPDNESERMSYIWECSSFCSSTLDEATLSIDALTYTTIESTQTIRLTVSKSGRSSSIKHNFSTTDESIPTVSIIPLKTQKVNNTSDLTLSAQVQSATPIDRIRWSLIGDRNVISNSVNTLPSYQIQGSSLRPGATYTFQITVLTTTEKVATGQISFEVNRPPRPGTFSISPMQGYQLETKFTLEASGYTDEDVPLSYQFFKGEEALADTSQALSLRTMLASSVDTLILKVYDSLGSFYEKSASVTVLDMGDGDISEIAQNLSQSIDVAEDLRMITVEVQQIGDQITSRLEEDPNAVIGYKTVPKSLVDALDSIMDKNTVAMTSENAQSRFTALGKAVQVPELIQEDTATQDKSLSYIQKVSAASPSMNDASFAQAITPIGSIVTAKKVTDDDNLDFMTTVNETIKKVSKSVLNGAIPGQDQSNAVASENLKVSLERISGSQTNRSFMAFNGIKGNGQVRVSFPQTTMTNAGQEIPADDSVDIIAWQTDYVANKDQIDPKPDDQYVVLPEKLEIFAEELDGEDVITMKFDRVDRGNVYVKQDYTLSATTSISAYGSGKVQNDGTVVQTEDLTLFDVQYDDDNLIQITIPLDVVPDVPECKFLNSTFDWSPKGCTTEINSAGDAVNCFCNHLSEFTVDSAIESSTKYVESSDVKSVLDLGMLGNISNKNAGGLILAVFMLWGFLLLSWVVKKKDDESQVLHADLILKKRNALNYILENMLQFDEVKQILAERDNDRLNVFIFKVIKELQGKLKEQHPDLDFEGLEYVVDSKLVRKRHNSISRVATSSNLLQHGIWNFDEQSGQISHAVNEEWYRECLLRGFPVSQGSPSPMSSPMPQQPLANIEMDIEPEDVPEEVRAPEPESEQQKLKCCEIPDYDQQNYEVIEQEGTETQWDIFCRIHDVFGIFLVNSDGFSRFARLLVLFCSMIGELWILGAFFGNSPKYDRNNESNDDMFSPEDVMSRFGVDEILFIVYSFVFAIPATAIIRAMLSTSQYSTYVDSDEILAFQWFHDEENPAQDKKRDEKCTSKCVRHSIGYTIAAVWIIFSFLAIIILSVLIEKKYNAQTMWIFAYFLQILLDFIVYYQLKAYAVMRFLYWLQQRHQKSIDKQLELVMIPAENKEPSPNVSARPEQIRLIEVRT